MRLIRPTSRKHSKNTQLLSYFDANSSTRYLFVPRKSSFWRLITARSKLLEYRQKSDEKYHTFSNSQKEYLDRENQLCNLVFVW